MKRVYWAFLLLFLASCQFHNLGAKPGSLKNHALMVADRSEAEQEKASVAVDRPDYPALSKSEVHAQLSLQNNTLVLGLQMPPLLLFQTQMLDLAAAGKITASVTDSHGKIYYAVGADASHQVAYPVSGVVALTFNNVLPDDLLLVEMQVVNTTPADIPQADLAAVLKHTGISNPSSTINFQTTAIAKTMKALLAANATRARVINLSDLNTLMATITGIAGADPSFTYAQNHPSLVKTASLATDLLATDPTGLTAASYRGLGATVDLTVSGLVGSDKIQVQVTDAASAVRSNLANGASSGSSPVLKSTPGTGIKVLVSPFGSPVLTYTYVASPSTLTLTEGGTQAVTITATPTVTLTGFSPSAGLTGAIVTLSGTGFTGATAVRFNGVNASYTVDSDTQITATVPATATDGVITVVNGGSVNSASSFDVNRAWLVKADAAGANSGLNWTDAFPSLKSAITASATGDQIWMAAGAYMPGALNSDYFQMKAGVNIYGGFAGNESTLAARNPAVNLTILSGDLAGDDTGSGASYAVVGTNSLIVIRGGNTATLDGVTIRGANGTAGMFNFNVNTSLTNVIFDNNFCTGAGCGLNVANPVSPTYSNLTFSYNRSSGSVSSVYGGGALNVNLGALPTLTNCNFSNNTAARNGGAIMVQGTSNLTLNNPTFSANQATGAFLGGGAIYNTGNSTVTVNNGSFTANTSAVSGGAIYNDTGSTLTINQGRFVSNSATSGGGAIRNANVLTVSDSVFSQNSLTGSSCDGGAILSSGTASNASLTRVLFNNNALTASSVGLGGAVEISGGGSAQGTLTNVVFADNSIGGTAVAGNKAGNGLMLTSATVNMQNVTFSNNTGGALGFKNSFTTLTIRNTLLWNTATDATLGTTAVTGNLTAGSDPFVNSASPLGVDGIGITSDDGLNIAASASTVINQGITGVGIPATDILGLSRTGNPEPGAYEYP